MTGLSILLAFGIFGVSAALGRKIILLTGWEISSLEERFLYCVGLGLGVLGFWVFFMGITGILFRGVLLFVMGGLVLLCWKEIIKFYRELLNWLYTQRKTDFSSLEISLIGLLLFIILLNGFIAMAPLTGSDSMQYHFDLPKVYARAGMIYPMQWFVGSYLIGLPHMLILTGMVLGADGIALAVNFGSSVLGIFAILHLSGKFIPRPFRLLPALIYASSPMVYWQATSGYIDLWTVFYTLLALCAMIHWLEDDSLKWLAFAGLFSGFAASSKYMLVAVPLLLGIFIIGHLYFQSRKIRAHLQWKPFFLYSLFVVISGFWPYLRNFIWTGDPVYPLLTNAFNIGFNVQSFSMPTPIAGFTLAWADLALFPFRFVLLGENYGGGHLYGPVVIAFLPFLFWTVWKGGLFSRVLLGFCVGFYLLILFTSQIPRYLLPIFPVLTMLVIEGMVKVWDLRLVRFGCVGVLLVYFLFSVSSNLIYARDFFPVLVGSEGRDEFLRRKAADYPVVEFVNRVIPSGEKAVVMLSHTYHLNIDYVVLPHNLSLLTGSPETPSPLEVRDRLKDLNVTYFVKVNGYSEVIREVVKELEACCLQKIGGKEVTSLRSRLSGTKARKTVEIFKLR